MIKWRVSISQKLLISVLMVSSVVSLLATGTQLYWDYRVDLGEIDRSLDQIQRSYVPSLSANLWNYNAESMRISLEGIKTFRDVEYAAVSDDQRVLVAVGAVPPAVGTRRVYPLTYIYQQKPTPIGSLVVVTSMQGIYGRLWDKVLVVLATQFVKTILFSCSILAIFQFLVTRHIEDMARYFQEFSPRRPQAFRRVNRRERTFLRPFKFKWHLRDEIDELSDAINQMGSELKLSYDALDRQLQLTKAAEQRLLQLNSHLEAEVETRTLEVMRQQENMQNSAKLASLGQMASGIAHEINNPLAIIEGLIFRIEAHFGQKVRLTRQDIEQTFSRLHHTVERISRIIMGLRTFSRDGSRDAMQTTHLSALIGDSLSLCRERIAAHGIQLVVNLPPDDPRLKVRPTEICQIIVNLLNNSFDAVRDRCDAKIQIDTRQAGDDLEICLSDNGDGVAPEIRNRIMDPFYTTKPVGEGTGLGLSISRGIAKSHGGQLYLDTASSLTTFVLRLPLDRSASSSQITESFVH